MIQNLSFRPFPGLRSPHLQTILGCYSRAGTPPPSSSLIVSLKDGDNLHCETSTPPLWHSSHKTIVMVHGLGGSANTSGYMIRLSRKLFQAGMRVVRVNLRGCGAGNLLARRPYHAGTSDDILHVIKALKLRTPDSPIVLLGFSLGGNIVLKLAGELAEKGTDYLEQTIAVCPPVDLEKTISLLSKPSNNLYHRFYVHTLQKQSHRWTNGNIYSTLSEFDNEVTSFLWGFRDALDYYKQCSSLPLLPQIKHPCRILFAADDPFIDYRSALVAPLNPSIKISLCQHGGHMGFVGWGGRKHPYFWLDSLITKWI